MPAPCVVVAVVVVVVAVRVAAVVGVVVAQVGVLVVVVGTSGGHRVSVDVVGGVTVVVVAMCVVDT